MNEKTKMTKIAIVNPFANVGHMNSYLFKYSSFLKEMGVAIDVYTASLDDDSYLKVIHNVDNIAPIDFLNLNGASTSVRESFLWRLLYKVRKEIFGFPPNSMYYSLVKYFKSFRKYLFARNSLPEKNHQVGFLKLDNHYNYFIHHDGKYDYVLYMYLDLYDPFDLTLSPFNGKTKFIGLLFHPTLKRENRLEGYIATDLFDDILFLQKDALYEYSELTVSTRFHLVPEVAQYNPSDPDIKSEIQSKSKNRIIIALTGNIVGHKNLNLYLQLIEQASPDEFFFILAGNLNQETLDLDEFSGVGKAAWRENVFTIFKYFESENTIDSIISESDYLFAAYCNSWGGSANVLEKGRRSGVKLIGNANIYVGQVIETENLGFSIDINQPAAASNILTSCKKHLDSVSNRLFDQNDLKLASVLQNIIKG